MITKEELHEILYYCDGKLFWRVVPSNNVQVRGEAGYARPDGYRLIEIARKKYLRHRLVWLYHYGYLPEHDIDHVNRDRSDDRIENLRHVSRACNLRNTGNFKSNTSGVKGVYLSSRAKRWTAYVTVNRKTKFLGQYKDFDEAVLARLAAEQCLDWSGCDYNSPARLYAIDAGLIKNNSNVTPSTADIYSKPTQNKE